MIDMSLRLDSCRDIDSKCKYRYEELENSQPESNINGKQTFLQGGQRLSFYSFLQIMFMKIHKKIRDVKSRLIECNYKWKHQLIPVIIFSFLLILFMMCLVTLIESITPRVSLGSTANVDSQQSGKQQKLQSNV